MINVLIADDHFHFRKGLILILRSFPFVDKVFEAEHGIQAVQMAKQEKIKIVILDFRMPNLDGYDAARLILRQDSKKK